MCTELYNNQLVNREALENDLPSRVIKQGVSVESNTVSLTKEAYGLRPITSRGGKRFFSTLFKCGMVADTIFFAWLARDAYNSYHESDLCNDVEGKLDAAVELSIYAGSATAVGMFSGLMIAKEAAKVSAKSLLVIAAVATGLVGAIYLTDLVAQCFSIRRCCGMRENLVANEDNAQEVLSKLLKRVTISDDEKIALYQKFYPLVKEVKIADVESFIKASGEKLKEPNQQLQKQLVEKLMLLQKKKNKMFNRVTGENCAEKLLIRGAPLLGNAENNTAITKLIGEIKKANTYKIAICAALIIAALLGIAAFILFLLTPGLTAILLGVLSAAILLSVAICEFRQIFVNYTEMNSKLGLGQRES